MYMFEQESTVHWVGTVLYQMVDMAGYIGSGQHFIKWWIGLGTLGRAGQYFIKWWLGLGTLGRNSTLSNGG